MPVIHCAHTKKQCIKHRATALEVQIRLIFKNLSLHASHKFAYIGENDDICRPKFFFYFSAVQ